MGQIDIREPLNIDPERTCALANRVLEVCYGARSCEVITALHSIICDCLAESALDLPTALVNVDNLAEDMREFLRKRMGN